MLFFFFKSLGDFWFGQNWFVHAVENCLVLCPFVFSVQVFWWCSLTCRIKVEALCPVKSSHRAQFFFLLRTFTLI